MDAIGTSTRLMWAFILIYTYPVLLFFFSISIWFYNEFKRTAFISYIADAIMTAFILLGNIYELIYRIIDGNSIYHLNIVFLILSTAFIILSISFWRKNKNISNISMNVSTILCMIVLFNQMNR